MRTYYVVETKYWSPIGLPFEVEKDDKGIEIKHKTSLAAMRKADKLKKEEYGVVATKIVKVTRESVSRREILKGAGE